MTKPLPSSLEFLLQVDMIEELLSKIGKEQWQTLYFSVHDPSQDFTLWCGLLDGNTSDSHCGWYNYRGQVSSTLGITEQTYAMNC